MGKRVFLFLTGVLLSAIGGLFMWLMGQSYLKARETRTWVETPAVVLEAEIIDRQIGEHVPVDYAAHALYGYEYQGKRLTSELIYPRGVKWAKNKDKAMEQLKGLSAGQETTCWVNPENPETAILKHDTKAAGYSIWFPTVFFIGGIGVMLGAFRKEHSLPRKRAE